MGTGEEGGGMGIAGEGERMETVEEGEGTRIVEEGEGMGTVEEGEGTGIVEEGEGIGTVIETGTVEDMSRVGNRRKGTGDDGMTIWRRGEGRERKTGRGGETGRDLGAGEQKTGLQKPR
jgi:hypothetical protein